LLPWRLLLSSVQDKRQGYEAIGGSPLPDLPDGYRIIFIKMIDFGK
jgi:hypothetical protein